MRRLCLLDVLHRSTVIALVGISALGLYTSLSVHQETLEKGRAIMVRREVAILKEKEEIQDLATAAQEIIASRSSGISR